jgi:PBP4 family serine-type D-alanyl-D-alanine carboxypeptidase
VLTFPSCFVRLAAAFFLVAVGSGWSFAQEPLAAAIQSVTQQPRYKQSHWGALFVDLTSGEVVFEEQADKLFAPASTTKLYTVACALDAFGAEHRFVTPVVRRGEINEKGDLMGELILVASGDLSFGGRTTEAGEIAFVDSDHTYANGNTDATLTAPDPLGGLNDLAKQVAAAGIKCVRGDVLIDDRLFDKAEGTGSGPSTLTPMIVNDNVIDLLIEPTELSRPAKLTWRPQSAAIRIDAKIETAPEGTPFTATIRDLGAGRFAVSGRIAVGYKPVVRVAEVSDAASYARTLFIEALARAGVSVAASALSENSLAALPTREEVARLPQIARHTSPPLSESARLILKVSHNLQASTLPILVATKHGARTLAAGLKCERDFLAKAGVDVDTISFGGGAGGARSDCVTPRATVQLLRHMAARPDSEVYRRALPRLGVDGTLSKNVGPDSPARDKVLAKTGTLYWDNTMNGSTLLQSKALAGYLTTSKGRSLAFALFVNNAHLREGLTSKTIGDDLAKVCEIILQHE